jgi:hypothetical protein
MGFLKREEEDEKGLGNTMGGKEMRKQRGLQ